MYDIARMATSESADFYEPTERAGPRQNE